MRMFSVRRPRAEAASFIAVIMSVSRQQFRPSSDSERRVWRARPRSAPFGGPPLALGGSSLELFDRLPQPGLPIKGQDEKPLRGRNDRAISHAGSKHRDIGQDQVLVLIGG